MNSRNSFTAAITALICTCTIAEADTPTVVALGLPSAGTSTPTYRDLIHGCIRPKIIFKVPPDTPDTAYAQFEVDLQSTGEQSGPPRLTKPSGVPGYDDAAYHAILGCDPFPRDKQGSVPRRVILKMYPTDLPSNK